MESRSHGEGDTRGRIPEKHARVASASTGSLRNMQGKPCAVFSCSLEYACKIFRGGENKKAIRGFAENPRLVLDSGSGQDFALDRWNCKLAFCEKACSFGDIFSDLFRVTAFSASPSLLKTLKKKANAVENDIRLSFPLSFFTELVLVDSWIFVMVQRRLNSVSKSPFSIY